MIVLVTGATSGFGVSIARRFAASGHRIIATGRRTERLAALAAELGGASEAPVFAVSGATGAGVDAVLDALVERLGGAKQAAAEAEPDWSPL